MASVRLVGLEKAFPSGKNVVDGLELSIADGELFVLVGPSGCGKSTVLRLVAGLEAPTRGEVWIGDDEVTGRPPQARDVAMVFQDYALYPHKTVRQNLGFGLRMRGVEAGLIERRVREVAALLGLEDLLDRKPRQLSGGQRQRVALGRAIARQARAYLLDEPLSNLDAKLRVQTRTELAGLQRRLGATMLYLTHDQEEAMTLGDRVGVMHRGRLEQVGPPLEVYQRPASLFVASFVGSPEMSFLEGRGEAGMVRGPGFSVPAAVAAGRAVVVGIRPHDVEVVPEAEADAVALVEVVEPLGAVLLCHLGVQGQRLRLVTGAEASIREGERLGVRLRRDRVHLFEPSGRRL